MGTPVQRDLQGIIIGVGKAVEIANGSKGPGFTILALAYESLEGRRALISVLADGSGLLKLAMLLSKWLVLLPT